MSEETVQEEAAGIVMVESPHCHKTLVEALAAAQLEFKPIPKNKEGRKGNQTYKYATLDVVLDATRPALNHHGIALSWTVEQPELGMNMVAHLHFLKESLQCKVPMYMEADMKSLGSAMTYAKRYSYLALIGCTGDEDDDGDAAGKPAAKQKNNRPSKGEPSRQETGGSFYAQPAQPAKPAGPPSFEQWQAWTDEQETPEAMLNFFNRAAAGKNLNADKPLFERVLTYAIKHVERQLQAGKWTEEQTLTIDTRLAEIFKSIQLPKQKDLL